MIEIDIEEVNNGWILKIYPDKDSNICYKYIAYTFSEIIVLLNENIIVPQAEETTITETKTDA